MLKKRILASSMASVMALTSICSVAFADDTDGVENYGLKTRDDLASYIASSEIVEKGKANDYGAIAITNFQNALQYAGNVASNSAASSTEVTAAYRELAACAAKMRHYTKEELKELCDKALTFIGDGTNKLEGTASDLKYDADDYNKLYSAYEVAAARLENFDYYVEIERRDEVDTAYETLEALMPLNALPIVTITQYKTTMDEIRALLDQKLKRDAWTRINLGETGVDGYQNWDGTYGYFIWRMEEASKEAEKRFDRFNDKNQSLTSDPEIVANWEAAKKLVTVFSAGVNAATVSYDKLSARQNDIVAIVGKGGEYHNRLVFDYASVDDRAELAGGTAKVDDTETQLAAATATVTTLKTKSAEYLVNRLLNVVDALSTTAIADGIITDPTKPYKVQYMLNGAKTAGADDWKDVITAGKATLDDPQTSILDLWSLDLNGGKLGAAELKLRVVGGDDNKGVPVFCLYDKDGYLLDFFTTQNAANDYKTALENRGDGNATDAAVTEFGKASRPGSYNGMYTIDIASMTNLSEFLKDTSLGQLNPHKVTATQYNGGTNTITDNWAGVDTNNGNGIVDGYANGVVTDADNHVWSNGNRVHQLGYYIDSTGTTVYNTIFNTNTGYTYDSTTDNSLHGTSWDPTKTQADITAGVSGAVGDQWVPIATTINFLKAAELGQNYVDGVYGETVANNTTNIAGKLAYTTGDNKDNTIANRSADLILKVGTDGAGNPIWNDLYQDVLVDTNGDWLSRLEAYPTYYKLDSKGNRNTTTAETTNVYNYVRYAMEDVYGTRTTTGVAYKLHTRADIRELVAKTRELTTLTLAYDAWADMNEKTNKAANDALKWVERAEKNGSFLDQWTDNRGTKQTLDTAELFNTDVADKWFTSHAGVSSSNNTLNLSKTAVDSDEMYHYLEGYYNELNRLYEQFKYTYGQVAGYIVDCEIDYASNEKKQNETYRQAIDNAAYALSVVKARDTGLYAGEIYEAFTVGRTFNSTNRLNLKGYAENMEDTQSLTQKNLVDALKALKDAREGKAIVLGDLNGDGQVNTVDATIILKHVLGIETITDADKLKAADYNEDGKVNTNDATDILKSVLGIK